MIDVVASLLPGTSAPWAALVDLALKATLLLLLAFLLNALAGRRRALVQSAVWNACVAGLLLLPIVSLLLPRLTVACLPGSEARLSADHTVEAALATPDAAAGLGGPLSVNSHTLTRAGEPDVLQGHAARPAHSNSRRDWVSLMLAGYVAVAAIMLVRVGVSLAAVAALKRSAAEVRSERWLQSLERWRARLGVRGRVRLGGSPQVSVPVLVGWMRPMILVPEGMVESSASSSIDAILLHELAHVRRGDYVWNLLLQLAQAVYWPQPLVWLAGRSMAAVREQACDELCITWLDGEPGYCATLLDVAAGLARRPRQALGLAMTRSTRLGRRLTSLERSPGAASCVLRWPARAAVLGAMAAAVGLLGALQLTRSAAASPQEPPAAEVPRAHGDEVVRSQPTEPRARLITRRTAGPGARKVKAVAVRRGKLERLTVQPGVIEPGLSASLYAAVPGTVADVKVQVGDAVKPGQLLLEIDAPELRAEATRDEAMVVRAGAALQRSRAGVAAAEAHVKSDQALVEKVRADVTSAQGAARFREKEYERFRSLAEKNAIDQGVLDSARERLDAAKATVRSTEAQLATVEAALVKGKAELEEAKADAAGAEASVRVAEAGLETSRSRLAAARTTAPIAGVISHCGVNRGDSVQPGSPRAGAPLITILQTNVVRVVVNVPDAEVLYLDRGDPVSVRLNALGGRGIPATVSRVGVAEDPSTQTLRAEIDLPNPDGRIRVGMYANVTIVLVSRADALMVPSQAVVLGPADSAPACFRVVDGRAVRTRVQVGLDDGRHTEILRGLKEGDVVVTDPAQEPDLKDGDAVDVAEPIASS